MIAAQGLNAAKGNYNFYIHSFIYMYVYIDKRVYVSVAVGHSRKRTKTFKGDGIPYWNEEFSL